MRRYPLSALAIIGGLKKKENRYYMQFYNTGDKINT